MTSLETNGNKNSENQPETPPRRRAPRWMKVLLTVSLAANLAVIGLALGLAMHGPLPRGGQDNLMSFAHALPRDHQRALREDLRAAGIGLREAVRHQRNLGVALSDTLRAAPFDIEAVSLLLANQRDRLGGIQTAAHHALITRIAAMSAGERSAYADALQHHRPRRD